jgi:hypothetical protein
MSRRPVHATMMLKLQSESFKNIFIQPKQVSITLKFQVQNLKTCPKDQ